MTGALLHSSQIAVALSLTITTETKAINLPLANLTPILIWLWSLWQGLHRLVTLAATITARFVFALEVGWCRLLGWLLQPAYMPVGVG